MSEEFGPTFITITDDEGTEHVLEFVDMLEHNGQISFLPRAQDRPLTPADMHLAPEQEYLPTVVVMDGQALAGNLKSAGKDEKWLLEQLDRQGYRTPKAVFLATLDKDMNLTAYPCAR